jgi:hypothetical protein
MNPGPLVQNAGHPTNNPGLRAQKPGPFTKNGRLPDKQRGLHTESGRQAHGAAVREWRSRDWRFTPPLLRWKREGR